MRYSPRSVIRAASAWHEALQADDVTSLALHPNTPAVGRRLLFRHSVSEHAFADPRVTLAVIAAVDTLAQQPPQWSQEHMFARKLLHQAGRAFPLGGRAGDNPLLAPMIARAEEELRRQYEIVDDDLTRQLLTLADGPALDPVRRALQLEGAAGSTFPVIVTHHDLPPPPEEPSPANLAARRLRREVLAGPDGERLSASLRRGSAAVQDERGRVPDYMAMTFALASPVTVIPFWYAALIARDVEAGLAVFRHEFAHHKADHTITPLNRAELLSEVLTDHFAGAEVYPRNAATLRELATVTGRTPVTALADAGVREPAYALHLAMAREYGLRTYAEVISMTSVDGLPSRYLSPGEHMLGRLIREEILQGRTDALQRRFRAQPPRGSVRANAQYVAATGHRVTVHPRLGRLHDEVPAHGFSQWMVPEAMRPSTGASRRA